MLNKLTLNRTFVTSSLILGILMVFNSCKKDLLMPQAPSETLLAKTKQFYSRQLLKLDFKSRQQSGTSGQSGVASTRKKPIPIWEEALIEKNSNGETIVTVPFAKFKIDSKDLDYTRKFTFSESKGEIVGGEIVEVYSSPEVIAKDGEEMILKAGDKEIKGFNGTILSYNIDYSYKEGKSYKDGLAKKGSTYINSGLPDTSKKDSKISKANTQKLQIGGKLLSLKPSNTIGAIRPEVEDGQDCEDYYWCYIEKDDWGNIVYLEVLGYAYSVCVPNQDPSLPGGVVDYYIDCAGVRDGSAYNSDCGCIGGTTGIQSCAQKAIIDSLQGYPCAQNLLAKLPSLDNQIATLIKNTFGGNNIDLEFHVNNSLSGTTVDGSFEGMAGIAPNMNVTYKIGLNPDILKNASQEYILVTMYHEALHAYVGYAKATLSTEVFQQTFGSLSFNGGRTLFVPLNGHFELAANNYLTGLKEAIIGFNSNYDVGRANALAMGGVVNMSTSDFNINNQERDTTKPGYTGTRCP